MVGYTDIRLKAPQGNFEFRTAGIMLHNQRLLVMRDSKNPYYYIPGGAVLIGETGAQALKRELNEEMGLEAEIGRLLWVTEGFFTEAVENITYHHLTFYYLVHTAAFPDFMKQDFAHDDIVEGRLQFCWKSYAEMQDLYFHPVFVKQGMLSLPETPKHLIISE